MKINILGTDYKVEYRDFKDDNIFKDKGWCGYCSEFEKLIVIGNHNTFPELENETKEYCDIAEKVVLRHEILHAFLFESGLNDSSLQIDGAWARNEEMIDWFAIQFPKILEVYKQLDIL